MFSARCAIYHSLIMSTCTCVFIMYVRTISTTQQFGDARMHFLLSFGAVIIEKRFALNFLIFLNCFA